MVKNLKSDVTEKCIVGMFVELNQLLSYNFASPTFKTKIIESSFSLFSLQNKLIPAFCR